MAWFEFSQNNSGGSFITNENVCHRLFIEANRLKEAIKIAKSKGVYFNGVDEGIDCSCCGDRWYKPYKEVNIEQYKEKGYPADVYSGYADAEQKWFKLYGDLPRLEEPSKKEDMGYKRITGKVYFNTIEQYAQFMADAYGWTTPDGYIYYLDGTKKEIFSRK